LAYTPEENSKAVIIKANFIKVRKEVENFPFLPKSADWILYEREIICAPSLSTFDKGIGLRSLFLKDSKIL